MTPARKAFQRGVACFALSFMLMLPTPATRGAEVCLHALGFTGPVTF